MFIVMVYLELKAGGFNAVVSHISRKTSEMWGTRGSVAGREWRDLRINLTSMLFARPLDPGSQQHCPPMPFYRAAIADP
jgi:hypothetical protein